MRFPIPLVVAIVFLAAVVVIISFNVVTPYYSSVTNDTITLDLDTTWFFWASPKYGKVIVTSLVAQPVSYMVYKSDATGVMVRSGDIPLDPCGLHGFRYGLRYGYWYWDSDNHFMVSQVGIRDPFGTGMIVYLDVVFWPSVDKIGNVYIIAPLFNKSAIPLEYVPHIDNCVSSGTYLFDKLSFDWANNKVYITLKELGSNTWHNYELALYHYGTMTYGEYFEWTSNYLTFTDSTGVTVHHEPIMIFFVRALTSFSLRIEMSN